MFGSTLPPLQVPLCQRREAIADLVQRCPQSNLATDQLMSKAVVLLLQA